ncbi:triose-phosphate isomerase [Nitrosomonas sp.]|uniref:triose-phosphate isomerase n=1 Tax=Nitrosomonas sp. TaxID=42353 RepID=UPI0025DB4CEB|nr:triose-phosphate isomerase [Nitrosomonas sp.]MCC6916364.1 triose-phosphate isomerase [Nitrosomonas sp.]
MARARFVAGNWKMHGNLAQNQSLLEMVISGIRTLQDVSCAVCVPYPYISQAQLMLKGSHLAWGAQNVSQYHQGAYTGEVSADMLADLGCQYVIVGHSERRTLFGETDQVVAEKFRAALGRSLMPILCVGETLAQREQDETEKIIARQLDVVINLAGIDAFKESVVAYEPIWAIGTGKTATPHQAQEVHAYIRNRIAVHDRKIAENIQILYGGSVKASNARELFEMPDIDGGLIGGASLVAAEFVSICLAAQS